MTVLKKNIAANFAGSFWQALMALLFIPLYIKFLGIESYGLIGIYATICALFALIDMGLSATLSREMARLSTLPDKKQDMRDLVRSLEVIYWCLAAVVGMAVIVLSPYVAHYWIRPDHLSADVIEKAVMIMGIVIAIQWPVSLYSGGLIGLQRQVLLNGINMAIGTFRGLGAVLVLWLISPTIYAYFTWQMLVSAINVILVAFYLRYSLPKSDRKGMVRWQLLRGIRRFAAGISGITILATILTQIDKVILSKMLSLETFGYYTLANVVAISLYRIISPVFSAIYPRLTQLVSLNDTEGLKQLYHKGCQLMSVLILPTAMIIAFFAYDILLLWTQNPVTAKNTHTLVSILIIGTALNGLMNLPYALQLAHGWTRLGLYTNLISTIILVPLLILMISKYGAIGAASTWVILNSGYFLITVPILHRRFLQTEKWRWYGEDVGIPFIAALATAAAGWLIIGGKAISQPALGVSIFIISFVTIAMTSIATPVTRKWIFLYINRFKLT